MKNKVAVVFLTIVLVTSLVGFSACGTQTEEDGETTPPTEGGGLEVVFREVEPEPAVMLEILEDGEVLLQVMAFASCRPEEDTDIIWPEGVCFTSYIAVWTPELGDYYWYGFADWIEESPQYTFGFATEEGGGNHNTAQSNQIPITVVCAGFNFNWQNESDYLEMMRVSDEALEELSPPPADVGNYNTARSNDPQGYPEVDVSKVKIPPEDGDTIVSEDGDNIGWQNKDEYLQLMEILGEELEEIGSRSDVIELLKEKAPISDEFVDICARQEQLLSEVGADDYEQALNNLAEILPYPVSDPTDPETIMFEAGFLVLGTAADLAYSGPIVGTYVVTAMYTGRDIWVGTYGGASLVSPAEEEEEETLQLAVNKLVSVDGGATWEEDVEQEVGQNVQFQITVTNNSDMPLANIVVSDELSQCFEYVQGSATPPPTPDPPSSVSQPVWNFMGSLQPGDSIDIIYSAYVAMCGECENQVLAEGNYDGQVVSDWDSVYVVGVGCKIGVDKDVSIDGGATWEEIVEQEVGENVLFRIIVVNHSCSPMTNIVITDNLPACLEYVDGPAVEVCPTTSSPYYNLPGDDTPTWKCTSGLQPGDFIEVIYSAQVTCAGNYTNIVSVQGECDGQIATFEDMTYVEGVEAVTPCEGGTEELTVCWRCDNLNKPTETDNSPSSALLNWIDINYATRDGELVEELRGTKDCDEDADNQYWAHTFTGLGPPPGCHIIAATLQITLRNDHDNDHLKVGCISGAGDVWEVNDRLTAFGLNVGELGTITLDLSNVFGVNLLDIIEGEGFLDVAVDDDSPVDCARLIITYGP